MDSKGLFMPEKMRCFSCRGAKQVAKLGGIMGDCNACSGSGLAEKPVKVAEVQKADDVKEIIKQVSESKLVSNSKKKKKKG